MTAPTEVRDDDADYQDYLSWKNGEGRKVKAPDVISPEALLAQIQRMQKQMDAMRQAQGIPADPIDAAVKALVAHVKARQDANPQYDLSELMEQLEKLPEQPNTDHAELVKAHVDEQMDRHAPIRSEMAYIAELSRTLHKLTLQKKLEDADNVPVNAPEEEAA